MDAVVTLSLCAAVCTRDRPDSLRRALESLHAQSDSPDEIVVVDNAPPSEATFELIQREFPAVRYVREESQGLDFARNRALRETGCEVVAFIDDDVVVSQSWCAAVRQVFKANDEVTLCTGRVEALSLDTDGEKLFEENRGFSHGSTRIALPRDALSGRRLLRKPLIAWSISAGVGCNLAVRRHEALELGGFDDALDLGDVLAGGGDHDLIWRTLDSGAEVIYEPAAMAWHAHRECREAAIEQILDHNRATVAMLTKSVFFSSARHRPTVFLYLVWRVLKPNVRLVARFLGRDPLPLGAILRLWWHSLRGVFAYPVSMRTAGKRRSGQGP